jgi:thiol:disulfide interchange protein DsbG
MLFSRLLISAISVVLFFAVPAIAQTSTPDGQPKLTDDLFDACAKPQDINSVPILSSIIKSGAKLYYFGQRSKMDGWLIVKDGQVQMIYVTPDGQTAIIGGMFTKDGENVTSPQVEAVMKANKEVGDLMTGSAKQREDVAKAGGSQEGIASVPGNASGATNTIKDMPVVPMSPGERLIHDLQAAAGVTLGHNENAEILIVIDPVCPHCKAMWKELRDSVYGNKVQVKLIPVSNSMDKDDLGPPAKLLEVSDPLDAWDKYVAGDKTILAGKIEGVNLRAVAANRILLDRWNIKATPYLVYRSKDGRVKIVQGKPERMAAVLSDLLR